MCRAAWRSASWLWALAIGNAAADVSNPLRSLLTRWRALDRILVGPRRDPPRHAADHVDWTKARRARLASLKPSTRAIPLRLPARLPERIRIEATHRDVLYQSLIKICLAEKVEGR